LGKALRETVSVEQIISQGVRIIAIIVLAVILHQAIRFALRRAARGIGRARGLPAQEAQRLTTLVGLVSNAAGYVIFFVAAVMALREAGVNTTPIMGAAGVVGLAVGFGAQNLVRDVVSGFFILLEGQYYVGDSVEINSVPGTVEEVGLRVTKLRGNNGALLYFNNGLINAIVRYPGEGVPFTLHVPASEDAAGAVMSALNEFNRQFSAFAGAVSQMESISGAGARRNILRFRIQVRPGAQSLAQERLASRVRASLEQAGVTPVPEAGDILLLASAL
jgi:small conductance mechanosensitive channel